MSERWESVGLGACKMVRWRVDTLGEGDSGENSGCCQWMLSVVESGGLCDLVWSVALRSGGFWRTRKGWIGCSVLRLGGLGHVW